MNVKFGPLTPTQEHTVAVSESTELRTELHYAAITCAFRSPITFPRTPDLK